MVIAAMPTQLQLFPMAPTSREQARDGKILMALLRKAATPALVGSTGMTRRQLRILMRPLPPITVPR